MNKYDLYFDGSVGPNNPGGVGSFGFDLKLNGKPLSYGHGVIGQSYEMFEAVAEFYGLLYGLVRFISLVDTKNAELNIIGDSRLVIDQLTGKSKKNLVIKEKGIVKNYLNQIRNFLGIPVNFKWVPREENLICDALSKVSRGRLGR